MGKLHLSLASKMMTGQALKQARHGDFDRRRYRRRPHRFRMVDAERLTYCRRADSIYPNQPTPLSPLISVQSSLLIGPRCRLFMRAMVERQYQLLSRGWRVHWCRLLRLFSGRLIWRRDGRRAGDDTKTDQSGYGEIFHTRFLLKFLEREKNFRARYYFSFSFCSPSRSPGSTSAIEIGPIPASTPRLND
jgi:hypothetical protein